MKCKYLIPLMLGVAFSAAADGYQDGIEYYKAGQYDNAAEILQRTLNDPGTDKALAYYYIGQTALAHGDKAAAQAAFKNGVAANAENPYNYVGLGAIDLLNGAKSAAEDNFKLAQKYGKKNNEITVDIARAYYKADPVAYAKEIEKFLAKAHKDSKHAEPAIYILEGDMLFDQKDLGGAAGKYEMATTYDLDNPEGYVKYANAYIGVNPQYSVSKLEELLAKQPNSALAQRELAEKYYETSQWTKAAQQYGNYIQNPNHFPADKSRYSVLLYANSEYQKSLDVARELLAQTPNDFQMLRIELLDLAALDQNEEAVKAAEKFFAVTPTPPAKFQPNDYTTYADVLEKLGQDSVALIQYQAAVNLDPSRPDNYKSLSNAYTKAGKYQEAAEAFDQYIANSDSPSLTDYLQASGRWLNAANRSEGDQQKADADRGLEAINKVIAGTSEVMPEYLQRRGRFFLAKGGNDMANPSKETFDAYTEVLAMLDSDPANADVANPKNKLNLYKETYLILGNYYKAQGDTEKTNEMYAGFDRVNSLLAQ